MRSLFLTLTVLAVAGTFWWLSARGPAVHPDAAEFVQAAGSAHVEIGGVALVLPLVATDLHGLGHHHDDSRRQRLKRDADRAALRAAAGDPRQPLVLDRARIVLGAYGWRVEPPDPTVCGHLERDWSRALCDDPWSPIKQALPVHGFLLLDGAELGRQAPWYSVGGENRWDQVSRMTLRPGQSAVVCDTERRSSRRFCTAARPLSGTLIAVWDVWEADAERPISMADREGAAIEALFNHGLLLSEDLARLEEVTCALRRPGSVDHPSRPVAACH